MNTTPLVPPLFLLLWIVSGFFGGAWLHGRGYRRKLDGRPLGRLLMWAGAFICSLGAIGALAVGK